jgi:predicted DNA binding protein
MRSLEREKVKVLSFSITNVDLDFNEVLTSKQKEILSSSLECGYYRFPRKVSLNGLAAKLGISPSTLCVHLQKIESKFLNPNHLELIFGERI